MVHQDVKLIALVLIDTSLFVLFSTTPKISHPDHLLHCSVNCRGANRTVGAAAMTKTMPTKNGVGRVPVCISPRGLDDPLSPPRRKRQAPSQAPWKLTPLRDQPPSSKSKPASSTTSVKEIAVTSVKSVPKKMERVLQAIPVNTASLCQTVWRIM